MAEREETRRANGLRENHGSGLGAVSGLCSMGKISTEPIQHPASNDGDAISTFHYHEIILI